MKKTEKIMKLADIHANPDNPRTATAKQIENLRRSIREFPEMTQLRPIVVDENNMILGGNMRYQAMKLENIKESTVVQVEGLTEDQKREFIIKDNVAFGDWDWDALANSWDVEELQAWGLNNIKTGLKDEKEGEVENKEATIVSSFITFDYSDEVTIKITDETAGKLMNELVAYRDEHKGSFEGFWDEKLK